MIDIENRPLESFLGMARFVVSYAIMAVFWVLDIIQIPFVPYEIFDVPFTLICVFYWTIYRPTLLPAWLIFIVGIGIDALTMMPLGLTALILIGAQKLVLLQRRYLMGQTFIHIWAGFTLIYALSIAVTALVFALKGADIILPPSLMVSTATTLLAFPFVALVLHLGHKLLPIPETQKSIQLHRRRTI
jgi:rod shape-determining protein MreD